jgi:hypothetical protein
LKSNMSRRKHKSPFKAPSRTWEKYQQKLKQSVSDETVTPSSIEEGDLESTPTDSPVKEDTIPPKLLPKKSLFSEELQKKVGFFGTILGIAIVVIGIIWFFWDINASVNYTKTGLNRVETKVEGLDKEWRTENQDIKIYLAKILEKFERLFGILQKPIKDNNSPAP